MYIEHSIEQTYLRPPRWAQVHHVLVARANEASAMMRTLVLALVLREIRPGSRQNQNRNYRML